MIWQAEDFWQWSCDYYARIKQPCLIWQDGYGANVNMLLLAIYLAAHQVALSLADWRKLQHHIAQSNADILRLRQQRYSIKSQCEQTYQQLLRQELLHEQQQQQLLMNKLNTLLCQPDSTGAALVDYLSLIVDPAILVRGQWRQLMV